MCMGQGSQVSCLCMQVTSWQQLSHRLRLQPVSAVHLLSSISAVVGNPGQANYAAANGALTALARQQAAMGLPGTAGTMLSLLPEHSWALVSGKPCACTLMSLVVLTEQVYHPTMPGYDQPSISLP